MNIIITTVRRFYKDGQYRYQSVMHCVYRNNRLVEGTTKRLNKVKECYPDFIHTSHAKRINIGQNKKSQDDWIDSFLKRSA